MSCSQHSPLLPALSCLRIGIHKAGQRLQQNYVDLLQF
ncbi:hypothetical protein F383_38278 [Gossypium arboreum]|uniref:Uncharacterized protein n=1 Tax=Gossypium arboreum TaxID=29729 RepID=A0A0B0ME92_GOSAR|nr:hypothetical protein F383_38278 [Gossypium arboreum]